MKKLPACCIPFWLTSPPYDEIREYGRNGFDFQAIADELYRVTIPGGVGVWVVQEQIRNGSETGTSSAQRLHFQKIGFDLHDTLIMVANGYRLPHMGRYCRQTQYAFVLSKGRPRVVNVICDRPNSTAGERSKGKIRGRDGTLEKRVYPGKVIRPYGRRGNVWVYEVGWGKTTKDDFAFEHSAVMPEAMAEDLIISWSLPGDLVFDPMCGAATTCKMALLNDRHYLGMEIVERYCEIARRRMRLAHQEHERRLTELLLGFDPAATCGRRHGC